MRLKCIFNADRIPVAYNMMFVSLIKECLKIVDEKYFNEIFLFENRANKMSKPFAFSVGIKGFELQGDEFIISGDVELIITSPDTRFFINLYNGLLRIHDFRYKNYLIKKKKIILLREKQITQDEVVFKTLSPVCFKNKSGRFLDIEDNEFTEELNYLADLVIKNFRGYGLKRKLSFKNVSLRKRVVKIDRNYCAEKEEDKYKVNAYFGEFKLSGDAEDLNLLYQLGLSFRRNQGFGVLEVM
ncbi:CRISPR associated protein Cas6 [Caloramator mitchellensis]|uniref:CRISPR associated protein Cas6 n=1 Tax=Caloramator mitchellensis TaxID=908809 RepID=A0A0R3JZ97_CALMK|nr:CRISPR-associated endoribonuclease Cas6 [Caloramator mitchellensis]KRQ85893.1 CRISPR associated protein Cas6 [Caloramator mitchellensis]